MAQDESKARVPKHDLVKEEWLTFHIRPMPSRADIDITKYRDYAHSFCAGRYVWAEKSVRLTGKSACVLDKSDYSTYSSNVKSSTHGSPKRQTGKGRNHQEDI